MNNNLDFDFIWKELRAITNAIANAGLRVR